tara:strand:- start:4446 stop:4649 length:204 start_codon:yes stop_codon:yes gene_type:complete
MKFELNDNAAFTAVSVAVLLAVSFIGTYGCHQCELTKRGYAEAGLEQVQMAGSQIFIWQKIENLEKP